MTETENRIRGQLNKRQFIKLTGSGTIAIITGGLALKEAEQFVNPWIETPFADYYPLYEQHIIGVTKERIPQNIDGYFNEGKFRDEKYNHEISSLKVTEDSLLKLLNSPEKELLENGVAF